MTNSALSTEFAASCKAPTASVAISLVPTALAAIFADVIALFSSVEPEAAPAANLSAVIAPSATCNVPIEFVAISLAPTEFSAISAVVI